MRRWISLSLLLVLSYPVMAGFVAWRTYLAHIRPDYRPRFEARWIHPPETGVNQAYFRKTLYIRTRPVSAWLKAIGRDGFTLWINGARVESPSYESGYPQEVFDIAQYLNAGRNVIAIRNNIDTYHQEPRIAVEGQYTEWNGAVTTFRSDASWRTAWRLESLNSQEGIVRPTPWFKPDFDDGRWPFVREGSVPDETITKRLRLPESIFTTPLGGPWLWHENPNAQEAFFRLSFELTGSPRDSWVRIMAKRYHRVLVNGYFVATHESAIGTEADPHGPVRAYNISPFLKRGHNVVAVQAANSWDDRGLYADGFVKGRDGTVRWFTAGDWKASDAPTPGWEKAGFDDSGWKMAAVAKPLTPKDQTFLINQLGLVRHPLSFQLKLLALFLLSVGIATCLSLLVWIYSARTLARLTGDPAYVIARWLALTFALPILFLLSIYLLGFDARLALEFPYKARFLWGSFALLILLNAVVIAVAAWPRTRDSRETRSRHARARWEAWRGRLDRLRVEPGWILAASLSVVGFLLRVKDLGYEPLGGDETSAALYTQGVLQRGYPSIRIEGNIKYAVTSELTLFMKAPFMWLLGGDNYAHRFTDVCFGAATILLLYAVGKMCHSRRAGLLAAAVYTFLPSTIGMTAYSRYPCQQQFFVLLTAALFILAFRDVASRNGELRTRELYLACAGCLAVYLSWEGGVFFLPSVAVGILLMTRPNFGWLKNPRLWAAVIPTVVIVFMQLGLRLIAQADRLVYGSGARDAGIKFMWLYPFYDPYFYIRNFFLLENHHVLAIIFVLGAPLWFRRSLQCRILGFLAAIVIMHLTMATNLLELSQWRYVYLVFALMVLASSITVVMCLDYLGGLARSARIPAVPIRALRHATAFALVGFVLLFSTEFVVKLYNMPYSYTSIKTRLWAWRYPSMAGVAEYLRANKLPSDAVIAINPHVFQFLSEPADYFIQSELRLSLNLGDDPGTPIHRMTGVPTILSSNELRELLNRYPRIWLVSYGPTPPSVDRGISNLIHDGMQPVYEDYLATVYLFGGKTPLRQQNGQNAPESVGSVVKEQYK